MSITKETVIDKIEILETGHVQVRRATYFLEDGVRVSSPLYHRISYAPGAAVAKEDAKVRIHCNTAWTPEVIAAYRVQQELTRRT